MRRRSSCENIVNTCGVHVQDGIEAFLHALHMLFHCMEFCCDYSRTLRSEFHSKDSKILDGAWSRIVERIGYVATLLASLVTATALTRRCRFLAHVQKTSTFFPRARAVSVRACMFIPNISQSCCVHTPHSLFDTSRVTQGRFLRCTGNPVTTPRSPRKYLQPTRTRPCLPARTTPRPHRCFSLRMGSLELEATPQTLLISP